MNDIDKRIINELIPLLISVKSAKHETDFCVNINLLPQNIKRIKQGLAHFTPKHILLICKTYNINANYIFGIENNVFNINVNVNKNNLKTANTN